MENRLATLSQRRYINDLVIRCQERKIELPFEILDKIRDSSLSSASASDIIDDLKFELGWG